MPDVLADLQGILMSRGENFVRWFYTEETNLGSDERITVLNYSY